MKPPTKNLVDLKDKVDPKPLDELTSLDAEKGKIYLCMDCGQEFEEGKNARGHACTQEHRRWIRHSKLPKSWDSPYRMLAEAHVSGEIDAY